MTSNSTFVLATLLALAPALSADVKFAAEPKATKAAEGATITFAVSAATDAEVAIVDGKGAVVRHLAAGLLGENAPPPFKKGSLAQELTWDGKDDAGKQLMPLGGQSLGFKARVLIGAVPKLDKVVGWDGANIGSSVQGLAVGKDGELFVLDGDRGWGRSNLRVFDRGGKYLRTIMPYPAGTPKERLTSVGTLDVDGETLPVVYGAHSGQVMPLTCGMRTQTMAFSPRGHLVMFGAVGSIAEHGPPRHLLAMHPRGGAPEGVSFVGPAIRPALSFLGGAGERDADFREHLAVSPDGERIYLTISSTSGRLPQRHVVFSTKWSDPQASVLLGKEKEAGDDDAHFNDPQGLATDKAGNLYVCDRGNNRVMVFSAGGEPKLLGKFAVGFPYQIAVHPAGEIYVLSRKSAEAKGEKLPPIALVKFAAWPGEGKGEPKELARLDKLDGGMFALDPSVDPAKLWVSGTAGVFAITDKGASFESAKPITTSTGLNYPMFVAADPARNRVLIREKPGGLFAMDLDSGATSPLPIKGADIALDRDGRLYVMDGYGTNSMSRYSPDGKPLPFPAAGSHTLKTGTYRGYGPNMGLRGHCVAPNGDIYLIRSNNGVYGGVDGQGTEGVVDVYAPDGSARKQGLIVGMGAGDCGLGVDAAGNVYVGMNIKPADAMLPAYFAGKAPTDNWKFWYKAKREPPWHYMYQNTYLTHLGSVFKFGPAGGQIYGWGGGAKGAEPSRYVSAANAPKEAATYRSSYLSREIKVVGAQWRHAGAGPISATDFGSGDSGCICMTSRLAVDAYGRVFAPDAFRFSVDMLDTAGNPIARIGRYGNADSSRQKGDAQPEIGFVWPAYVSTAAGKVYVSDLVNRRIVVVRFDHAAAEECALP